MDNKKEKAVVLGSTGNIVYALANVLIGIKKHSPYLNADFIIFHKDISENDQQLLNSIIPCKIIEFNFPVEETEELQKSSFGRYSKLAFSRYECFNLLDEYKKVVWLDVDILIQKDISGLFNLCENGIGLFQEEAPLQECFSITVEGYEMTGAHYNSGVIVLSENLPGYKKYTEWLYNKTLELGKYLCYADQGIINLLIQEFKLDVTNIGEEYNYHPLKRNPNKAKIIHSYSPEKFWHYYNPKYHYREWDKNYKKWTKMGGSKYIGYVPKPTERIMRTYFPGVPNPIRQTGKFCKYVINSLLSIKLKEF